MQPPRPVSVTIFGILNIAFAVMGVVGLLFSHLVQRFSSAMHNPVLQSMHENPDYQVFMKVSMILGLIVSPILLAAGIGLLKQCNWARLLSIAYAIYAIIAGLITPFIMYRLILKPAMESMHGGPAEFGAIIGGISAVIGAIFGLAYPVLLIIFMTRPKVIVSFQPAAIEIPPAIPGQP